MTVSAVWMLVAQLSAAHVPLASDTILAGQARGQAAAAAVARREQAAFDASRFDSLTANALRALFADAADLGLPVRPLINRALEGAARRSPSDRILRVVRDHAVALQVAKRALGATSSEDELEAGAVAVRAGLDDGALASIRDSRPLGAAVVPLVVVTDLVRRGVPIETAREAVVRLGRASRPDDALLGLQAVVAKNAQRGPGMALDALKRYVQSTGANPAPAPLASPDRKPVRPPRP